MTCSTHRMLQARKHASLCSTCPWHVHVRVHVMGHRTPWLHVVLVQQHMYMCMYMCVGTAVHCTVEFHTLSALTPN